jgi:cysteine-rich repeat protein
MSRFCPSVVTVVLASGCGPLVPYGDQNDDGIDVTSDGDDDDDDDDGDDDRPGDADGEADGGPVDEGDDDDEAGDEVDTDSGGVCGDGIVDGDEECDDGNDSPNDGCEADCTGTPAGTLLREIVGDADTVDVARGVAIEQDGTLLVAGSTETDGLEQLWVYYENVADGTSGSSGAPSDQDEYATSIAIVGDLAFVVGLRPDSDSAVLLRRDDDSLTEIPGGPTDIIPFSAVVSPTAEGFVVVTNGGGFGDFVANVRRFDAAGVMIADVPQEEGIFVGVATPDATGGTILGGGTFGGEGSAVWLSGITSDASTSWVWGEEAQPGVEVRLRGLATAPDGSIVGVGTRGLDGPGNDNDAGWIWWWTADGVLESDGPLDIGGAAARPTSVVVGANGIVVGGTTTDVDDGFVAGFDLDGALLWGHQIIGDFGIEDGVLALAIEPGVAVYAVGWITQLHTGEDAWIGVFSD